MNGLLVHAHDRHQRQHQHPHPHEHRHVPEAGAVLDIGGSVGALLVTCPPVVFGIFRYLMLLETEKEAEAPELVLLKDRPIQVAILLWLLSYSAVLYFGLRLDLI